jgi:hypothetical protein
MIGSWRHTSLLYEKLGLLKRKHVSNTRSYPLWKDCIIGDALDMKCKLITLEKIFATDGPRGLLESFFESQDVGAIIRGLVANL